MFGCGYICSAPTRVLAWGTAVSRLLPVCVGFRRATRALLPWAVVPGLYGWVCVSAVRVCPEAPTWEVKEEKKKKKSVQERRGISGHSAKGACE